MHPSPSGDRAPLSPLLFFEAQSDPGTECLHRHADARPDADRGQFALCEKFVDLAAADTDRFGGLERTQEKFVHASHLRTGQNDSTHVKYPSSMPRRSSAPPPVPASLTDPETGELRFSTPSDLLWIARRVEIEGDMLRFDWSAGLDHCKVPATLLERFLQSRTDEAIWRFAARFGPLDPRGLYLPGVEAAFGPPTSSDQSDCHREFLAAWRRHQAQVSVLLALVASVRDKESPSKEMLFSVHRLGLLHAVDRLTVAQPGQLPRILTEWNDCSAADRLETARRVFLSAIGAFVRECGLRPALTLEWTRSGVRMGLVFQDARADFLGAGVSLFGALTVQLMSAATGSALAICSACGDFFVPRRRTPAFGKRRYCRSCGRTAALRDAKADYRARLRTKNAARRQK